MEKDLLDTQFTHYIYRPSKIKGSEMPSSRPKFNKIGCVERLFHSSKSSLTTRPLKPREGRVRELEKQESHS